METKDCPSCNGRGKGSESEICVVCNGTGKIKAPPVTASSTKSPSKRTKKKEGFPSF